jgi:hypothetical protein
MRDLRPQLLEELRPAVLDFLHRVFFQTEITLYLGTMESPVLDTPEFGRVYACSRRIQSLDYDDICHALAEEIGLDLIRLEKEKVTKYGLYLYQVPNPEHNQIIRYAKQIG